MSEDGERPQQPEHSPTAIGERPARARPLGGPRAQEGRCLVLLSDQGGDDKVFPLEKTKIFIGRAVVCDVVVPDRQVSALHAELARRESGWWIRDLGSKNGTRVNGAPVREQPLEREDRIELAGVATLFFTDRHPEPPSARRPRVKTDPERPAASETGELEVAAPPSPCPLAIPFTELDEASRPSRAARAHGTLEESPIAISNQLARALGTARSEDVLLDRLADLALALFAADGACVFLCDPAAPPGRPALLDAAARARSARPGGPEPPASRSIVQEALLRRAAISMTAAASDGRIRAVMAAPIVAERDVEGVVYVEVAAVGYSFSRRELELLSAIAFQAAIALANVRYAGRLEERARRLAERLEGERADERAG
jgi:pSer/pThr/pTyr-binding forkhead associated (FHA) protein